jgi:beta-lactamase regulating signal transducer with metallopeptidase domain
MPANAEARTDLSPGPPLSLSLLFALWLAGVAWSGIRVCRQVREGEALRRRCLPAQDETLLQELFDLRQRLGLKRTPPLLLSETAQSPYLLGGSAPAILLPARIAKTFSTEEIRIVLAHELAHLKRKDLLWCWLPALAHALFFFHPLVWVANRELRLAHEMACDEMAVRASRSSAGDYGSVLLKVATQGPPALRFGSAAMGTDPLHDTLKRRLKAMRSLQPISRKRGIVTGTVIAALSLIAFAPWRVVSADPSDAGDAKVVQKNSGDAPQELPSLNDIDEKLDAMFQRLQSLGLSAGEDSGIKTIFEEARSRIRDAYNDPSLNIDLKGRRIKESFKLADERAQAALTPEHLKQLAQEKPQGKEDTLGALMGLMMKGDVHRIASVLGTDLSEDQEARLQSALLSARQQVQAAMSDPSVSKGQAKRTMVEVAESFRQQVFSILSPDQAKRLMSAVSERFGEVPDMDAIAAKIDAFGSSLASLNLTEDQKTSLRKLLADGKDRAKDVLADGTLSNDEKIVRIKSIFGDSIESMKSILSPEQRREFEEQFNFKKPSPGDSAADALLFGEGVKAEGLVRALALSPVQQSRLQSFRLSARNRIQTAIKDPALPDAAKKKRVAEIRDLFARQFRSLLTSRQLQELQSPAKTKEMRPSSAK